MVQENHSSENQGGFWYTYFGIGGAAVFAFLWVLAGLIWIYSVLKWG